MVKALTLVKISPGKEYDVHEILMELKSEDVIKFTHALYGHHDQLIYLEYGDCSNVDKEVDYIGNYVIDNIRSIEGVLNTQTYLFAEWS
ncbi:MAG: hypothetical protein ACXACX_20115 [Candidatus Hodarchaeales archaeon]|jgi:hypothetical protein